MQHKSAASCQVRQFSFWWIWGKSNKQALCSQWTVSKISQLFSCAFAWAECLAGQAEVSFLAVGVLGRSSFSSAGMGCRRRSASQRSCRERSMPAWVLGWENVRFWASLSTLAAVVFSTEVTLGGEELWQPGGRLPAGPLGCCILWNNRPTENDTNAWRGLCCFSLTSDYISCSALNSQPDFWRHPSTNTCKLRAVVLAGSFAWGSHSSGAAAHGVWRCGAGASARLSCRPLSFMDEVWKMCVHYRRVLNSSAWKLWWSKFHLKKNNN